MSETNNFDLYYMFSKQPPSIVKGSILEPPFYDVQLGVVYHNRVFGKVAKKWRLGVSGNIVEEDFTYDKDMVYLCIRVSGEYFAALYGLLRSVTFQSMANISIPSLWAKSRYDFYLGVGAFPRKKEPFTNFTEFAAYIATWLNLTGEFLFHPSFVTPTELFSVLANRDRVLGFMPTHSWHPEDYTREVTLEQTTNALVYYNLYKFNADLSKEVILPDDDVFYARKILNQIAFETEVQDLRHRLL